MFKNIGALEIIIIALVILMLFGAKKLPEFTRGLVNAKKEFKDSFKEEDKKDDKK
jgi:sec-independent protein translocase protein TatA